MQRRVPNDFASNWVEIRRQVTDRQAGRYLIMEDLPTPKRPPSVEPPKGPEPSSASCRPDFNPIELAFAKLMAFHKAMATRTVDGFWNAIAQAIDIFIANQCCNDFTATGYEPE